MTELQQVAEYAKKNYPKTFTMQVAQTVTTARGSQVKYKSVEVEPIVEDMGIYYTVKKHKDSSPIILSKTVLG